MRRRIAFVLCSVLAAGVLGGPVSATTTDCVASSQFDACSPAELIVKAEALRALHGIKPKEGLTPFPADDHIIVGFSSRSDADATARRHGARILNTIDRRGTVTLSVPRGRSAKDFVKTLRAEKKARFVELDHRARGFAQATDWGAEAVKAVEATTSNGVTGAGVTVAIVDTGVDYNHDDLDANMWTNGGEVAGNGLDDDGNGYVDDVRGWDVIGDLFTSRDPDNDPMDNAGHGTHVAGIVAAEDNTIGVRGVAPEATIMPVKVLDAIGFGWDSTIAEGIRYAVDNGADIINMSLGGYSLWPSAAMKEAVEHAADNGVAVVAAAGNAWFYDFASYPAGFPSVISVSAAREADRGKTWWSDWGHADFLAPGDLVLSSTPGDTYNRFSGTSMAAPHVAGALALVKDANPTFGPDQLEQALATTAIDTNVPGVDEVSGAGFPDVEAATGTLPTSQVHVNRAPWLIPADGVSSSTITLRILDAAGAPVAGATGTFSTDKGTLSDTAFVTDGDGEATTELTADDEYGSATVTASPVALPAASVRVIVEDDRVRIDDIDVSVPQVARGDDGDDHDSSTSSTSGPVPGEGDGENVVVPLLPGDEVIVRGFLGRHTFDFANARARFAWTVTGPDGVVPELSDSLEPIEVWGFGGQVEGTSAPMTIPFDAPEGTYTIEGTVTTLKPGGDEDHTFSKTFTVGEVDTEVLVVESGTSFDAESFNFLWPRRQDSVVRQAVEDLGRTVSYWNTVSQGQPSATELARHSAVVWLGGWDADLPMSAITSYLQSGGNLLLSGELYGSFARASDAATQNAYRNQLYSTGLLTQFFPDDNHQIYPQSVSGAAGGLFDGVTLDLNSFNLNHTGQSTAIVDEELKVVDLQGATSLFEWNDGVNSPAVAGVTVDTGFARVVNLGFGIEAVNGTGAIADVLDPILTSFSPAVDVVDVLPDSVLNHGSGSFLVIGDGFQGTGETTITLDGIAMNDFFVVDRGLIEVFVPAGFPIGTYDVTVEAPNGTSDTLTNAVVVKRPAPKITSVSPTFVSNDKWRTVRINGQYFRSGAKVFLQGVHIPATVVSSTRIDAAVPKGFVPLGLNDVKVLNSDGKSSTRSDILRVRYGFTFDMGAGADNVAVTQLQRRLKAYGFFPSDQPLTTFFGSITKSALIKYQKSRGLQQTGFLGYATRKKLNDTK